MSIDEFISKYDGKKIGYNGYLGECLSLVKQYIKELYGVEPPPSGVNAAYGYWTNFPNPLGEVFEKITTNPRPGDIVIWGTGLGAYGHIAIYLNGDENNFTSFDQNFPVGSSCHKQNHNYNNVIGYLRPRKEQMTAEALYFVLEPVWRRLNKGYPVPNKAAMMADCQNIADNYSKWAMDALVQKWIKGAGIMYTVDCKVSPALPVKNCTTEIAGAVKAEQNRIFNNLVK